LDGFLHGYGNVTTYLPFTSEPFVKQVLGKDYVFLYGVPFIKYYGFFESYFREYFNNRLQVTKQVSKGANLEKNTMTTEEFAHMVDMRKKSTTVFVKDDAIENRIIALVAAHPERQFVFVISPYHSSCFQQTPNLANYLAFKDQISAKKNVTFLDYSQMPLPDDNFLNTSHLNLKGAISFSHALHDTLRTMAFQN